MDDVGIDQLRSFGYGGPLTPPHTPALDVVARNGIRFRNVWAMPECSPSRAIFFEGRYPLRTNVYNAILNTDLANSQVSPYEVTTPKVLRNAGYTSALFGKFHLAGPDNNPFGNGTPNSLGFDYFHGFLEGAPHPIDTYAGNAPSSGMITGGPYTCGFVPNTQTDNQNGADSGACYYPPVSPTPSGASSSRCQAITQTPTISTPGRRCLENGGIFVKNQSCQSTPPSNVDFSRLNGYYVWPLIENDLKTNTVTPPPYIVARTYSPIESTTAAIDWIKEQPSGNPWMVTVAYSSIHAPYQQAPQRLTPALSDLSGVSCDGSNITDTRTLSNQMLEAMDTEIGRLLINTGLAARDQNGVLHYDPSHSNTMVVIIGDNGTYGPGVKAPFDLTHAKGFVNQTGVWVPLIVAGPLVNTPDRNVENMVNVADLFQLFGEMAGLDVRQYVPPARKVDSVSMLPYLRNPGQRSLREFNFTQTGINISATERPGPCVLSIPPKTPLVRTCVQLFTSPALCAQEQGTWYGPVNGQGGYPTCCALKASNTVPDFDTLPLAQAAVRNDNFKLIQLTEEVCSATGVVTGTTTDYGLYRVNQAVPIPKIDFQFTNLITDPKQPTNGLTPQEKAAFVSLKAELYNILSSEPTCRGDGNSDGVVDSTDIANWQKFNGMGSSWYDFPTLDPSTGKYAYDGQTDNGDLAVIVNNLGRTCKPR
jgi:arylsulfatase A-like enzyme